jgi:hypothetical protein
VVGLQGRECAAVGVKSLTPFREVGGVEPIDRKRIEQFVGLAVRPAESALATAAQGDRLMAGDDVHPADKAAVVVGRRLGEQDLDRALERVVGVGSADRHPACGAAKAGSVALEQRHGDLAAVGLGRCRVHATFKPRDAPRAPTAGILGARWPPASSPGAPASSARTCAITCSPRDTA